MKSKRQQLLVMETYGSSLRSEACGWSGYTGETPAKDPVGMTPPVDFFYAHGTPRHALGQGWFLMQPPAPIHDPSTNETPRYEWWFQRETLIDA